MGRGDHRADPEGHCPLMMLIVGQRLRTITLLDGWYLMFDIHPTPERDLAPDEPGLKAHDWQKIG